MSAIGHTMTELPGELHLFSPTGPPLEERVAPIFAECLHEHDVGDILVLKRFPTGIETFTDVLATHVDSVERPEVMSLTRFARTILEASPENPTLVSQHERAAVLASVLSEYEWTDSFLQQASAFDAFEDDVGRFTLAAAWQNQNVDTTDSSLAELFDFTAHLQEVLATNGYAERASIIPRALEYMETETASPPILDRFDVILTVEVEEFSALERRFLAAASTDTELVCVGERHGSIQRIRNEPGDITDYLHMETVVHDSSSPISGPAQVAAHLATGEAPQPEAPNGLFEITEETFADQVQTVAEEIERRRTTEGWSYDEFAVVLKDSSSPIQETVRILQQAGIPTASITTSALSDDPAARELYHVARYLESGGDDQSRTLLEARVPDFTTILDDDELATESVSNALTTWVLDTDLKQRVASTESRLEARIQFQHIGRVLDLARFVEGCPLLDSSWDAFCQALERAFRYSAPDFYSEVDVKEGGVLVDSARVVKNASWKAVFVLNVVEEEYPAVPRFSSLFPIAQLKSLPEYPAVTSPTRDEVRETFPTADDDINHPFSAYYTELSRRLLAVGANAATDQLYFCTYAENAADPGKYKQPSRFLQQLRDQFEFDSITHEDVHSQGRAATRVLSSVERALQDVRTAPVTGDDVDLDAVETQFGAIQQLLDETDDPELEAAFEAHVDFAEGRVRRD
jgi:hypothetical protein